MQSATTKAKAEQKGYHSGKDDKLWLRIILREKILDV